MDFIHLIRTDAEMADEFAYLIKESHPYDFKIVEYEEVNKHKQEYMTISARVKYKKYIIKIAKFSLIKIYFF